MAGKSKFVLRWKIDNTSVLYTSGKAERTVFYERGFIWTATVEKNGDYIQLSLRCGVDHNRPWKCEANLSVRMEKVSPSAIEKFAFDEANDLWCRPRYARWFSLSDSSHATVFEFNIHIITSKGGEPVAPPDARFANDNNRSNVILKIGDKKLQVYKECLAAQSPVFEAMFFGEFVENGKEEVEIKDVIYEEFVDLLNLVYLVSMEITDRTALHILKLADRFQMKNILDHSLKYLTQTRGIELGKKLCVAEQYGYVALKKHCLNSFTSVTELAETLKKYPEVDGFSDEMKVVIFNLTMKLKIQ